jgi:hypothetical protein
MSENFTNPSSRQIDELFRNCRNVEDVRELAKRGLENSGVISRSRDGETILNDTPGAPPPFSPPSTASAPQNVGRFSRVIYPHGNDRYELFGDSVGELDVKEARIRRLYGQK